MSPALSKLVLLLAMGQSTALLAASATRTQAAVIVARARAVHMAGREGSVDDGTFWSTLDGKDEDGISPDGVFPPGDDLVEQDLKRIFSIDDDEDGVGVSGLKDVDELQVHPTPALPNESGRLSLGPARSQLMWKLRQELGEDFNRIFDDPKIRGSDFGGKW